MEIKHIVLITTEISDVFVNCLKFIEFNEDKFPYLSEADELLSNIEDLLKYCKKVEIKDDEKIDIYIKLENMTYKAELLQDNLHHSGLIKPKFPPSLLRFGR